MEEVTNLNAQNGKIHLFCALRVVKNPVMVCGGIFCVYICFIITRTVNHSVFFTKYVKSFRKMNKYFIGRYRSDDIKNQVVGDKNMQSIKSENLVSVTDLFEDEELVLMRAVFSGESCNIVEISVGFKDERGDIIRIVDVDRKRVE